MRSCTVKFDSCRTRKQRQDGESHSSSAFVHPAPVSRVVTYLNAISQRRENGTKDGLPKPRNSARHGGHDGPRRRGRGRSDATGLPLRPAVGLDERHKRPPPAQGLLPRLLPAQPVPHGRAVRHPLGPRPQHRPRPLGASASRDLALHGGRGDELLLRHGRVQQGRSADHPVHLHEEVGSGQSGA